MLHVLLTILKILGILILVVLGIIWMVILLVLLVPVRYSGEVSFDVKPSGRVTVSWLLRLFSARVSYDGSVKALVKLLWFRLFDQTVWPSEPEGDPEEVVDEYMEDEFIPAVKETVPLPKAETSQEQSKEESKPEKPDTVQVNDGKKSVKREKSIKKAKSVKPEKPEISPPEDPKQSLYEKIQALIEKTVKKIMDAIRNISEKKLMISNRIDQVMEVLRNQENQKTFKLILRQIGRLFKHILPKKLSGRVRFGFDDPYTTGQILTYISPFYGLYARTFSIEPVFDENVLEGEVRFRGRIRFGSLLWIVIRIFLDKNFRKLLKRLLSKKK